MTNTAGSLVRMWIESIQEHEHHKGGPEVRRNRRVSLTLEGGRLKVIKTIQGTRLPRYGW